MLSLELIRQNPDMVRKALEKRQFSEPLDDILALDERRRGLLSEVEALRARRNEVSKQIGKMAEKPPQLIEEMRELGNRIKTLDEQLKATEAQLNDLLLRLPNIPHPTVPLGKDESENRIVRSWGKGENSTSSPGPTGTWAKNWESLISPAGLRSPVPASMSSAGWGPTSSEPSSPSCSTSIPKKMATPRSIPHSR